MTSETNPTLTTPEQDSPSDEEIILSVEDTVDDLSDINSEELLKIPKGAIKDIYKRLSALEEETEEKSKKLQQIQSKVQRIEDNQQNIEQETNILQTRADHINDFVEEIDDRLETLSESVDEKHKSVNNRITMLEESNPDATKSASNSGISSNASEELEKYSQLDDEVIEREFGVNMKRAVCIYRNFDEWSTHTSAGSRLKSGELRKLLKAELDRESLEWTPLYRAMDKFDAKTSDRYDQLDTKSVGRALIKKV